MNTETTTDFTFSAGKANLIGLVAIVPVLVTVGLLLELIHGASIWTLLMAASLPSLLVAVVLGCFAHELLHAFGFVAIGRANYSDVSFGMNWKALSPYAHCSAPLSATAYRVAALLPALVLGLIPMAIGFAINSVWLILFATVMIILAVGDFMIIWLIRSVPGNASVLDHPDTVGCLVADPSADSVV